LWWDNAASHATPAGIERSLVHFSSPTPLLTLSGSLRARSSNTIVLRALAALAPAGVEVTFYERLNLLPHFNPDLDNDSPPAPVADFRHALAAAHGVFISTPEYAHGVPGALKNALDWLVSDPAFLGKPVALVNARPGATHAIASLRETLSVMNARLIDAACVTLPLTSNTLDEATLLKNEAVASALRLALAEMLRAIRPA
jgi:NAD(P)H-dependent FMN reductase